MRICQLKDFLKGRAMKNQIAKMSLQDLLSGDDICVKQDFYENLCSFWKTRKPRYQSTHCKDQYSVCERIVYNAVWKNIAFNLAGTIINKAPATKTNDG